MPWKVLLAMVQEYDSELAIQIQACVNPESGNQHTMDNDNIIKQKPQQGTSRAYNLNRLKREAPELFEEVKAGKMSANARGRD
jgi:hypothetical protein